MFDVPEWFVAEPAGPWPRLGAKQPTTRPRLAAGAKVNSQFRMMDVFYKIRVTKSTKIRTPRLVPRRSSTEAQSETAVRVV